MNKLLMNKKVIDLIDDNNDLNISLLDNETIIINYFNHNQKNISINFEQVNNSNLVINFSCLINENVKVNIKGSVKGDNNKTVINVRAIAENYNTDFYVSVKADIDTLNNDIIEDLKGINEKGTISFMPILEVDTKDVNAAHYATIGSYDKNALFYLQSKGLNEKSAKSLLKKSFMYNLFNEEFINRVDGGSDKHE